MGEQDVATETGGRDLSASSKQRTTRHTHAGHGRTNHSVPWQFVFAICTFLRVGRQGEFPY